MILGELRPARDQLIALAGDADELGRADVRSAALVTLANIDSKQGRPDDARARLVEAAALAEEIRDARLRATAAYEFAKLHAWFDANPAAAIDELRIGIALADELDDRVLRIEGHMRLGTIYSNAGRLVEAEDQYKTARSLAGTAGSYRDEARASCLLAYTWFRRGDLGEGEHLALKALEWLERTGDTYLQMQTLRLLARYAMLRGDLDLAERRLQEALPIALESGGWLLVETYRYLVEVLVRQSRIDDARELCAFARRALPADDAYACAALHVAEGIAAASTRSRDASLDAFREALKLLEEHQLVIDLAEARVAFARALSSFGEDEPARAQIASARETFEQIGAPNLIAEIEREFGEMLREAGAAGLPQTRA
jgi:tetratricopeptide (TPR) repeat protein